MNSALRMILPIAVALLAGLFVGTRIAPAPPPSVESEAADPADTPPDLESERKIAALTLEIDELKAQLLDARDERDTMKTRLATAGAENEKDGAVITTSAFAVTPREPRLITDLSQARGVFDTALVTGDIETLWNLAADLLALGPEGIALFEELLVEMFEAGEEGQLALRAAFRDEERWIGRFLRTFAESHEDFLAYGLDLLQRDVQTMHPVVSKIRRELLDDEILPVILGFNGGSNPPLLESWGRALATRLEDPDLPAREVEPIIFGLAQIPNDLAVDTIVGYVRSTGRRIDDAIRALIVQGSPYALQAARDLLPLIEEDDQREALAQSLGL